MSKRSLLSPRRRSVTRRLSRIEHLETRLPMAAELVKNILDSGAGSNIYSINNVQDATYFVSQGTTSNRRQLWRTDGTSAGTANILPSYNAGWSDTLLSVGGSIYLTSSTTLDKVTGTTVQTLLSNGAVNLLGQCGGLVYFTADVGDGKGRELWRTDGSAAGTFLLQELTVGSAGTNIYAFADLNGSAYFLVSDATSRRLFTSNGSANSATLVATIGDASAPTINEKLVAAGSRLFFIGSSAATGNELWTSNGTTAGTVLLKDTTPGSASGNIRDMTNVNGRLYFESAAGLSMSDGTTAGTTTLTSLGLSVPSGTQNLTAVGNVAFFTAFNTATGKPQLWRTDATPGRTNLVREFDSAIEQLTNVGSRLYFTAKTAASGVELWRSAGTASGTAMVSDIASGTSDSNPSKLSNANGVLYFTANDLVRGQELWKSNGTDATTAIVVDLNTGNATSNPQSLTNFQGDLYFTAWPTPELKPALFRSDGTVAGTNPFFDYGGTLVISERTVFDGQLFFVHNGNTLFRTNGTTGGTQMLRSATTIINLVVFNNALYYTTTDSAQTAQLWRFSMATGSQLIRTMPRTTARDASVASPSQFQVVGSRLYFQAYGELWSSDGTEAGTRLLRTINTSPTAVSNPTQLTNYGGTLYFTANDGTGLGLWQSGGTASTTVRITLPGTPASLTTSGGRLFFTVTESGFGTELWRIAGTAAPIRVKDINLGAASSNPSMLTNVGGLLFFTANDGTRGTELWRSDGTGPGTAIVRDLSSGLLSTMFSSLYNADGTLYFSAATPTFGSELWYTDGTAAGTFVEDIVPGAAGSNPEQLTMAGFSLYFTADTPTYGREVWKTTPSIIIGRIGHSASSTSHVLSQAAPIVKNKKSILFEDVA